MLITDTILLGYGLHLRKTVSLQFLTADHTLLDDMSSTLDEVVDAYEPMPEFLAVMADEHPAVLLALDIGTSGIRAALFDEFGKELSGHTIRVRFINQSLAESGAVDADNLLTEIEHALDTFFNSVDHLNDRIELVAISCFWHSLVGVNQHNVPTTHLLGWSDTRAAEAVESLRRNLDERTFHQLTGCRFHASYWPAKLLRLQQDVPDVFRSTERWFSFADYLMLKWCGEVETSVSMASGTGLMNQRTCEWNSELVHHLKVNLSSLPQIAETDFTSAELDSDYAARWPQIANARILPAIGDGAANNIGAGCITNDKTALMIGTSGAMRVAFEGESPREIPPELWSYRIDRKRVIIGGALSDGGNVYDWMRRTLLSDVDNELVESELASMNPDEHGLTVLPFWNGERSTGWHSDARATINGITSRTRPIEILRAYMEAVAYRFTSIMRALNSVAPAAPINGSGYALHSSMVWVQILADVLGREMYVSNFSEGSTRGAALLALDAAGKIGIHTTVSIPNSTIVRSDAARHARYQAGLERHQKLYEQMFQH